MYEDDIQALAVQGAVRSGDKSPRSQALAAQKEAQVHADNSRIIVATSFRDIVDAGVEHSNPSLPRFLTWVTVLPQFELIGSIQAQHGDYFDGCFRNGLSAFDLPAHGYQQVLKSLGLGIADLKTTETQSEGEGDSQKEVSASPIAGRAGKARAEKKAALAETSGTAFVVGLLVVALAAWAAQLLEAIFRASKGV